MKSPNLWQWQNENGQVDGDAGNGVSNIQIRVDSASTRDGPVPAPSDRVAKEDESKYLAYDPADIDSVGNP